MPELRNDLVTGRVVLLAPGRAARPHTVAPVPATPTAVAGCPFCPGNEHETPPEVGRTGSGAPGTPGWRVRVVPNLYPIVGGAEPRTQTDPDPHPDPDPDPHPDPDPDPDRPSAPGRHEVVILDPDHSCDLGRLDDGRVEELFTVLRDRARVHAAAGLAHVQVLVNHGRAAGASIAHPHAQVIAIDFVPPAVRDELRRVAAAAVDVVAADFELSATHGGPVVDGAARAWVPWAAASPYETRVAAPDAGPRLEDTPDAALAAVARVTRDVVAGIGRLLGDVAYNVVFHNAPSRGDQPYHWYVSVVPRVSTVAGFELGTGVLVNTLTPADAAAHLRDAIQEGPTP